MKFNGPIDDKFISEKKDGEKDALVLLSGRYVIWQFESELDAFEAFHHFKDAEAVKADETET